jgi:hypothetical protein
MRLPGFSAETSLYKTNRHYRMIAKFGQVDGSIYPTLSINDLVKSSLDFTYFDGLPPISIRGCCRQCLSSIPCADESCRRQRLGSCTRKCGADVIGGCDCPLGREVCEGLCCGAGEVCTLDGCSPPNQVCNNHGGCLGQCLPEGCCPPHRIVCNNHCCEWGVSVCASDGNCVGCGDEGQLPCAGMTCKRDLNLNLDMLSNRLICTASCGHAHQYACRTKYPVPDGVRSRYRCFNHSKLFATGPADPSNCLCLPNTINDVENDVSDNSGFCISTLPAPGDIADPPDCDPDPETGRC